MKLITDKFSEIPQTMSITPIKNAVKELDYTRKRITRIPAARNSDRTIELRCNYAITYDSIKDNNEYICFVDEFGIQVFMNV